ncbi:hypothetical protein LCGC14_1573750 [marine sediment metagenome]|uniref:Uncharacterized protein n=1 Tax=marine sediment metagenome TaxID=412755 RepID=A0A0F9IIX1_9ZZZZ
MDRNETTLIEAIETTYFQHLVSSYEGWSKPKPGEDTTIRDQMLKEFAEGLSFKKGRNYIKIISSRNGGNKTVHSFIVLKPTKGYEIGDILKAAGWNAPATNFKRGNVFELWSLPAVTWTGAG